LVSKESLIRNGGGFFCAAIALIQPADVAGEQPVILIGKNKYKINLVILNFVLSLYY
jgi:hypothetical protein